MPVSFDHVLALPAPEPDGEFRYGDQSSQFARLWLPADPTDTAPLVVLVHGGCWLSDYDIDHIHPLAGALAEAGYAVWAPEYRRLGEVGGGWPGSLEDVAAAFDRLRAPGLPGLDLDRIVVLGHSAGGQLALWLAARTGFLQGQLFSPASAPELRGVIGLAAITDLETYAQGEGSCNQAAARLLGSEPGERDRRHRLASPSVLPAPVPVTLLQGSEDQIVPLAQGKAMAKARRRVVAGAGHFDLIHPGTPAFEALLEELAALLQP